MRYVVTIETDNDAFTGPYGPAPELSRILRELALRLFPGPADEPTLLPRETTMLRDINGNWVGTAGPEELYAREFGEG